MYTVAMTGHTPWKDIKDRPRTQPLVYIEWHEGLEADDEFPATRGGWFLNLTNTSTPGYIGPDPEYPPDGYETPGQAVDALVKWASDRGFEIHDFPVSCFHKAPS